MKEEVKDGRVVDGLDLVPAPVVLGTVTGGPLGLHGGRGGGEGGEGRVAMSHQRAQASRAEGSDKEHLNCRARRGLDSFLARRPERMKDRSMKPRPMSEITKLFTLVIKWHNFISPSRFT